MNARNTPTLRTRHRRLGLVSALLALSACGGAPPQPGNEASSGGETTDAALPPAPRIDGAEARALVANGAFLLDVTPPPRNARSELEGRVNIPLPQLRDRLDEVPRDRVVVAYCLGGRGSPRAGAILRSEGYDVRVLGARDRFFEGQSEAATDSNTGESPAEASTASE